MARARNLKPGFFKNEDLAECSPWARLCFAGLWTLADREGRLEDRPKKIKGELFAFDSVEVEPLLAELEERNFIHRYRVDGHKHGLIQVVEFSKHQNPHHREPPSDLPPPQSPGLDPVANSPKPEAPPPSHPPEAQGQPEASPGLAPPRDDLARGSSRADSPFSDSGTLIPDSPSPPPNPPPASPAAKKAREARPSRRCPASFVVTPEMRSWAAAEAGGVDVAAETAKFRDHEFATARSDWPATWRNWMRTAAERRRPQHANGHRETIEDRNAAFAREWTGGLMGGKRPITDPPDDHRTIDMEPTTDHGRIEYDRR